MKITEADFTEFKLGGKTYWKIDCTNEQVKQIIDNEEKAEKFNNLKETLEKIENLFFFYRVSSHTSSCSCSTCGNLKKLEIILGEHTK